MSARPLYLTGGSEAVFGVFQPAVGEPRDTAVLVCPPFGWEEICSRRNLREWADTLNAEGYPTLLIDLPGTGDSAGSPWDPGRLDAWSDAIAEAAASLRDATGSRRIAAVGIALGGMLAVHAASRGAAIDELVLWGVPARGRALVREMRAFSRLEASQVPEPPSERPAALPDGALLVAGFALSEETVSALEALDLAELPDPAGGARRVLLLERDGRPADPDLHDALERAGADVTVAPGIGYGAMFGATPQEARPAPEIFARVGEWLAETAEPRSGAPSDDGFTTTVELSGIRESTFLVERDFGTLVGVLTEPAGEAEDVCAVLLNSGALRRIGPNRMAVEMARRWAARGVPTLRLDLAGIGDSDAEGGSDPARYATDDAFYVPEFVEEARAALDALEERGLPPRFVIGGLCSGAYWAFYTALQDERVASVLMLNPRTLVWDDWEIAMRQTRDLRRKLTSREAWGRLARREASLTRPLRTARAFLAQVLRAPFRLPGRMAARRRAAAAGGDAVDLAFDQLRDRGQRAFMFFTGREPLHEQFERGGRLERLSRWPNIDLRTIPLQTDTHLLRPLWLQREVHELVDAAIEREIELARCERG